jgi:hypothetical protein
MVLLRVRDGRVFALGSALACLDQWTALILESGAVVIAGNGETMAFAADTGQALWHEQFSGEGRGLVSIASATDHSQADDR